MYRLPSADERETASMVAWQVRREPALAHDDVLIVHRVVGRDLEGWTRVVVYGVSRSRVMERLRVLDCAGMTVDVVTLATQGVVDWTRGGAALEALVHADGETFEWSVSFKGVPIFSRSFRVLCAGPGAGDALLRELSVSSGAFRQSYPDLASRIGSLNAFGVLSAEHMAAIRPRLNGRGDRDLLIFDGERRRGPHSLIPVIGLALKGSKDPIDVTPDEWRWERRDRRQRSTVRRIFLSAIFFVVLFCACGLFVVRQDAARWERVSDRARVWAFWSAKMEKRAAWEGVVPGESIVGSWDRLADIAPSGLYLTELILDRTSFRVSGWAAQPYQVLDLWERLRQETSGLLLERLSSVRGPEGERSVFQMVRRARSS